MDPDSVTISRDQGNLIAAITHIIAEYPEGSALERARTVFGNVPDEMIEALVEFAGKEQTDGLKAAIKLDLPHVASITAFAVLLRGAELGKALAECAADSEQEDMTPEDIFEALFK